MRPRRHRKQVNRVSIVIIASQLSAALVISETVLDADYNPAISKFRFSKVNSSDRTGLDTNHRFVNTTPNPKATKNSNGELVGPPPPSSSGGGPLGDDIFVVFSNWQVGCYSSRLFRSIVERDMRAV